MRGDDQRPLMAAQQRLDRFHRGQIQVVGGLVQHSSCAGCARYSAQASAGLSRWPPLRRLQGRSARARSRPSSDRRSRCAWAGAAGSASCNCATTKRRVQQRQVLIQIGGRRMHLAMPGAGLQAPGQQLQQCGLAAAVRATRPIRPTKPVARWSIWMFRSENSALPSGSACATLSSVSDGQSSGSPLHASTRADPTGPAAGRPSSRRRHQWRIGPILR